MKIRSEKAKYLPLDSFDNSAIKFCTDVANFLRPIHIHIYPCCLFEFVQDTVDILDSLLDQRNDMSFQEISTQVYPCIL